MISALRIIRLIGLNCSAIVKFIHAVWFLSLMPVYSQLKVLLECFASWEIFPKVNPHTNILISAMPKPYNTLHSLNYIVQRETVEKKNKHTNKKGWKWMQINWNWHQHLLKIAMMWYICTYAVTKLASLAQAITKNCTQQSGSEGTKSNSFSPLRNSL